MATFFKTIQKTVKHWYVPAIIGALLTVLGIYLFTAPLETYVTLTVLFSISFLVKGILETWFSIQNRKELERLDNALFIKPDVSKVEDFLFR